MQKQKYITNKDLLREIHRSKNTFSYFTEPSLSTYHVIVGSMDEITLETAEALLNKKVKTQINEDVVLTDPEQVVFRIMTHDHIPLDPERKRKPKTAKESYAKTNFPPFKHFVLRDGAPVEVGRSHWKGDLETGTFDIDHGRLTNDLARMFKLLVERYAKRGNWRGYTYNEDMQSFALLHLVQIALKFDESKSDNPFAFYTTSIKHCLAGDTPILTLEYGVVPIESVAEQDVHLLDGNGDWVKCHIFDHGVQETQTTQFRGGFMNVEIRSTSDHGWVATDGTIIETKDFAGHNREIANLRPSKVVYNEESYHRGIIHGLVYGDGSLHTGQTDFYTLRVCSHQESIAPFVSRYPFSNDKRGDDWRTYYIAKAWSDLKAFPANPGADLDYLLGFLRGWFAADGCVSKVPYATICGDLAEAEWLSTWGPLVGWHTRESTALAETTNFGPRKKKSRNIHLQKASLSAEDFLIEQHRHRWQNGTRSPSIVWRVEGSKQIVDKRMERVYCPFVPTTGTFALGMGIHSKNCFMRTLNLEKRQQDIRDDLLIVAGAAPSFARQTENEIEQRGLLDGTKTVEAKKTRGRKPAVKTTDPFHTANKAVQTKISKKVSKSPDAVVD